jgi:3-deoxy-D-manno-octulosonic-acid transferase
VSPAPPIREDPIPGLSGTLLHAVYDLVWFGAFACVAPPLWWRSRREPAIARFMRERMAVEPFEPGDERGVVLVHAVSVGEVKGIRSVVERLERERPDLEVVLSTTTSTGAEVARSTFPGRRVVRFPTDWSRVVRRFFERLQPVAVVLVELEVWPNFLREANRRGVPLAVVNGRITERSFGRYKLFHRLFPQFDRISLFCVQNETYAERFLELKVDPERVVVTGNVKIDGLATGRIDPGAELTRLLAAPDGRPLVVAASTHDPEERACCEGWVCHAPGTRLVLVPRHPDRVDLLVGELAAAGHPVQRLTELRNGTVPDPDVPVIVDTIGELEQVFGLADVAFVGGSLIPHGGHNVLEPAAQGVAVVTGPHTINFRQEVALLLEAGALVQAEDSGGAWRAVGALVNDPERRAAMAVAARAAIDRQGGATELTWQALVESCLPRA